MTPEHVIETIRQEWAKTKRGCGVLSKPIPREDYSLIDISVFDLRPTETQSVIQGSKSPLMEPHNGQL
ncbi:MAG: hypothetical protein Unbinned7865contig1001_10 [Prokaryotic dsDNA virus sp.]|nr:MAG: hypothetical protein Unbinned7865contig1001_10 [Prokaryotic dsDNA virus sp.]